MIQLTNGILSHETIGRVLELINSKRFQELFIKWMEEALSLESGTYIQLDGKTLKGNGIGDKQGIHLVSAYAHQADVVLGQIKCKEKYKEITAIPELLELLKLNNAIITIDAMGCQKTIVKAIVKSKCDYLLFKGDDCLIKNKITAENMAIPRRIAFNRMKMFDNSRLKTKKMKCAFSDNFRYQVLFTNFHA